MEGLLRFVAFAVNSRWLHRLRALDFFCYLRAHFRLVCTSIRRRPSIDVTRALCVYQFSRWHVRSTDGLTSDVLCHVVPGMWCSGLGGVSCGNSCFVVFGGEHSVGRRVLV